MLETRKQKVYFEILLHDIRSIQNVASIFRLADCIGCSKIILSGVTPGPLDRFGRGREEFEKISLGAEKSVSWERLGEDENSGKNGYANFAAKQYISYFKKNGGMVVALEQSENSVDYKEVDVDASKKFLVIPGREREGLEKDLLEDCDIIAEIPQYGDKESLNIFSSLSVVLFRWFDR